MWKQLTSWVWDIPVSTAAPLTTAEHRNNLSVGATPRAQEDSHWEKSPSHRPQHPQHRLWAQKQQGSVVSQCAATGRGLAPAVLCQPLVTTRMDREGITRSEVSQRADTV